VIRLLAGIFCSWKKSMAKGHPDRRQFSKVLCENDF
jgi:hypothetical protein